MKPKILPSVGVLREHFSYCKESGQVTLLKRTANRCPEGTVVGSKNTSGYLKVHLKGESYTLSRIIWKLVTGEEPTEIDHINRVRDDNRWFNLRNVTSQQNQLNRAAKGWTRLPNGRYRVSLHGKDVGYFSCPTAANFAYLKAKGGYFNATN